MAFDQLPQWFVLEYTRANDAIDAVEPQQALDPPAGKNILQRRIVFVSQKGERSHQRADACSGDDIEARPAAARTNIAT